jgi:putative hydrolase of the HAD superfamily
VAREPEQREQVALIDVDGTLYTVPSPLEDALSQRVVEAIAHFVAVDVAEARRIDTEELRPAGGTFRALVDHHGVAPEDYFAFLCGDETDPRKLLAPDPVLRAVLERCTARLFLFSNAPTIHCERVAEALGVRDLFEGIFEISGSGWVGKPDPPMYERALRETGARADRITAIDDMRAALDTALAYGMATVLISRGAEPEPCPHVRIGSLHELEAGAPWLFQ